ncbi:hypothetical protein LP415_27480 [Polaromonas sp. P1(28)-8]|nr:hypothetical protein LP415_27480 [Polaromonas sp. P1(28)-8]
MQVAERITLLIEERGADQIGSGEALIADYKRRLEFLRVQTVPQIWSSNAGPAVSVFMITMQGLQEALEKALPENQDLAQEIAQAKINAKTATNRLRALEARIGDLEPRSTTLAEMVGRIEKGTRRRTNCPLILKH